METHAKVLGILNILSGIMGLFGALVMTIVFGGVTSLLRADGDADVAIPIVGLTGIALVVAIVATSLPALVIGFGLYKLRPWSRVAGIVLSIVSLIFVPVGTALGIYGLWVLFSKDGQRLFDGTAQQV
jgi:hypothetical protein